MTILYYSPLMKLTIHKEFKPIISLGISLLILLPFYAKFAPVFAADKAPISTNSSTPEIIVTSVTNTMSDGNITFGLGLENRSAVSNTELISSTITIMIGAVFTDNTRSKYANVIAIPLNNNEMVSAYECFSSENPMPITVKAGITTLESTSAALNSDAHVATIPLFTLKPCDEATAIAQYDLLGIEAHIYPVNPEVTVKDFKPAEEVVYNEGGLSIPISDMLRLYLPLILD